MQIAEKIRKLIEHERSARSIGNLAEAEAFAVKIQELLMRHKLEMSDVEMHADPLGHEGAHSARPVKRAEDWSGMLAKAAASACMCDVVTITGTSALLFFGRGNDRAIAIGIWRFLSTLAVQLVKDDMPAMSKRSRMHPLKLRARFLLGFATAIMMRLAREKEVTVQASGEQGLIRVESEKKELATYKANAIRVTTRTVTRPRDSVAFRTGFARGTAAPLRHQHTLPGGER
jgi:hypothetical protein